MEQLIKNLLSGDNKRVKEATADLRQAYQRPETIEVLCEIAASANQSSEVRQYAAILLKKRLENLRRWQLVPPAQQQVIKQGMLNVLLREEVTAVRSALAQFIGVLLGHESEKDVPWMSEVLTCISAQCSSSDPKQSELSSAVFAALADAAPDQFIADMSIVCKMFSSALAVIATTGNMATPVIFNLMLGMTYLVPYLSCDNAAEQTYKRTVPLIIKSLHDFAVHPDPDQFVRAFDIVKSMADYTPDLLTTNIRLLLELCLEIANNTQLNSAVRVTSVAYLGWLVRIKKKVILKQKLIESIIRVIFHLMASASGGDDENDGDYFHGEDNSNPMTTATQTMGVIALNVPPEKLIPQLLKLVEPALQGSDPLAHRAAYLSLAQIAEGCSEAIRYKYLEKLVEIVKDGILDRTPLVRNAALFALGQFAEHLQPEITHHAFRILPILFDFLHGICTALNSASSEPKHIDHMFYALETFCEHLENALVPYLPVLMERLLQAMALSSSVHIRELSLRTISAVANAAKESMMPFLSPLIALLQTYFGKTDNTDILTLRSHAIDTLASIARSIGKANFMPLASDTMHFSLSLLEEEVDPDVRRALYGLVASLAEVVNEDMALVFPKIIQRLFASILSTDDVFIPLKDDGSSVPESDENEIDFEGLVADVGDNFEASPVCSTENSFLDEKEEAICTLSKFAEHTGAAFLPYLQQSYDNVYKLLEHPQADIRKAAIEALTEFIISLYNNNEIQGVCNAAATLIPKLGEVIRCDENVSVVMSSLASFSALLKKLKGLIKPSEGGNTTGELILNCIKDVLQGKVACQFAESPAGSDEETEESEYDEALLEAARNVLPQAGHAVTPDRFSSFFDSIYPLIVQKIDNAKNNDEMDSSSPYGTLAECFAPLGNYSATYFDIFCPLMLRGLSDNCELARQNAAFGLGELVLNAKDRSFDSFPKIVSALSGAVSNEQEATVVDNICGAIARLIITNCALVPLQKVLPLLLQQLPLREDFAENGSIIQCFQVLCIQAPAAIYSAVEQILSITIHVLCKNQLTKEGDRNNTVALLDHLRKAYPDQFNSVANSTSAIVSFLQTL